MDIILPRLHGDAVIKQLQAMKISKPIVVVTAISREVGVEKDLKKVKRDITFLQQPFSSSELVSAVKKKLKK